MCYTTWLCNVTIYSAPSQMASSWPGSQAMFKDTCNVSNIYDNVCSIYSLPCLINVMKHERQSFPVSTPGLSCELQLLAIVQ